MKKLLLLAPALFFLAGCGQNNDAPAVENKKPADAIKLNYSVFFPPTHVQAGLAKDWATEIENRTDGRVKITVTFGGAITKPENTFQAVLDSVDDIGMSAFAYSRGRFPLLEGLDLPHGYPDGVTATRVANELIAEFKPAELDPVKFFYVHAHGPGILATRSGHDVATLEDVKGKKIRGTGFVTATIAALGGTPVGLPQNDTYEALQKGTVDATFCPVETLKGWKQGEQIDAITDTRCIGYTTVFYVVMNNDVWKKLPADIQKIFNDVNAEWVVKHGEAWNTIDDEGRVFIEEKGRKTISLSESEQARWVAAVQPVIDDYIKKDATLPRQKFIDALRAKLAQ